MLKPLISQSGQGSLVVVPKKKKAKNIKRNGQRKTIGWRKGHEARSETKVYRGVFGMADSGALPKDLTSKPVPVDTLPSLNCAHGLVRPAWWTEASENKMALPWFKQKRLVKGVLRVDVYPLLFQLCNKERLQDPYFDKMIRLLEPQDIADDGSHGHELAKVDQTDVGGSI